MGALEELFARLFSRLGARAFSEYGVIGIVSVLLAYFVLLFSSRFVRCAFKRREELRSWFRTLGDVGRITHEHLKFETIHSVTCVAVLLIAALGQWPYFMYVLLRVFICGSSAYIASRLFSQHRFPLTWVAGAFAVLYNPVLPVKMARSDWEVINCFTAVSFLAFSIYLNWGVLVRWARIEAEVNSCPHGERSDKLLCSREPQPQPVSK